MARIQTKDFDITEEIKALKENKNIGALVTFTGIVRDFLCKKESLKDDSKVFYLEHYPGMTERILNEIERSAEHRFDITQSIIIHRVGKLKTHDNIVFVAASSKHRAEAFNASQFMIDVLKTQAPFWKKEGNNWVEAKEEDIKKTNNWLK